MNELYALAGAFFIYVLLLSNMSERSYAQFNTLTITGRVSHTELVDSKSGEFLAVTLLSDLKDDGEAVAVTFNTSNGLMALSKKGFLNNGRLITVTVTLTALLSCTLTPSSARLVGSSVPSCTLSKHKSLLVVLVPLRSLTQTFWTMVTSTLTMHRRLMSLSPWLMVQNLQTVLCLTRTSEHFGYTLTGVPFSTF